MSFAYISYFPFAVAIATLVVEQKILRQKPVRGTRHEFQMKRKSQYGFSMVELMVCMGIALVLMAMGWPLVVNAVNNYRLRGACNSYSNLIQTTRMRAVQDDRYYNIVNNLGTLVAPNVINAYGNTTLQAA